MRSKTAQQTASLLFPFSLFPQFGFAKVSLVSAASSPQVHQNAPAPPFKHVYQSCRGNGQQQGHRPGHRPSALQAVPRRRLHHRQRRRPRAGSGGVSGLRRVEGKVSPVGHQRPGEHHHRCRVLQREVRGGGRPREQRRDCIQRGGHHPVCGAGRGDPEDQLLRHQRHVDSLLAAHQSRRARGERLQLRRRPHLEQLRRGPAAALPQRGHHRGGADGTDGAVRRPGQEGRAQERRLARHGVRDVQDRTHGPVHDPRSPCVQRETERRDPGERLLPRVGAHRHGRRQGPQVSGRGRRHPRLPGPAAGRSHAASREVRLR